MGGSNHSTTNATQTTDQRIDGLLAGDHWAQTALTFGFPGDVAEYGTLYGDAEPDGFVPVTAQIQTSTRNILGTAATPEAQLGFTVTGFTGLSFTQTQQADATIRVAQTAEQAFGIETAWAYLPGNYEEGGDVWLHTLVYDYTMPDTGNYAHLTLIHEFGHSLGLAHPHEINAFGSVPTAWDAMEFTVMSYKSHPDAEQFGYTNGAWDFAQSYMMLDIAALQHLYGADYTTNSGDTVYRWMPGSGQTVVDGAVALAPGGSKIFATIWDGGGTDTFDLSAYQTDMTIRLEPGESSVFDVAQLAQLGSGTPAQGNIYNALLHQGDTRSLIENVIAGFGDDDIHGNLARNEIFGGAGADEIFGYGGRDRLLGQSGNDRIFGQDDHDRLFGAGGQDYLDGGTGWDILSGGAGRDTLIGGLGSDTLTGGAGVDQFVYNAVSESGIGVYSDKIMDFTSGQDKIDLAALSAGTLIYQENGRFSGAQAMVIARDAGADTRLFLDLNADGAADMRIILTGTADVNASDFIL